MVIFSSIYKEPVSELFDRFWYHEQKRKVNFSSSVVSYLKQACRKFTVEHYKGTVDLGDCLQDGFQQPHQKLVLDFIAQTKLKFYPPSVAKTCIDYLTVIVDKDHLVSVNEHIIIVSAMD